jgi:ammonia channel protein AmtB
VPRRQGHLLVCASGCCCGHTEDGCAPAPVELFGVVLIGVFASLAVNSAGVASGWSQLGRQFVLAVVALAYPFVVTWIILWAIHNVVGLRVGPDEQVQGLDLGELGEIAYRHRSI